MPYILKQLEKSARVDIVYVYIYIYISDSIKASTRERRGKGIRRKVAGKNKVPAKWMDFLRDESNKQELFAFLSSKIIAYDEYPEGKKVYATSDKSVLPKETDHMAQPCDHEEADPRLLLHLIDTLNKGQKSCLVRTVDTDVVVILIGKLHCLLHSDADICWHLVRESISLTGTSIMHICNDLGEQKSLALPPFHSFTGCDTTSAFHGRGKKLAWEAWNCYPEVTIAFTYMASNPYASLVLESPHYRLLERFTIFYTTRLVA